MEPELVDEFSYQHKKYISANLSRSSNNPNSWPKTTARSLKTLQNGMKLGAFHISGNSCWVPKDDTV